MKRIPLTKGQFAKVDDEDYKYLSRFKWHATTNKSHKTYYAVRSVKLPGDKRASSKMQMHRVIMKVNDPKILVTPLDKNGLNCQKKNLKKATISQIAMMRHYSKTHSSKYIGVSFRVDMRRKKARWRSCVWLNNKCVYERSFYSEIEAAQAYNKMAKKYHGRFARMNIVKK